MAYDKGKFRNIEFFVMSHDYSFGRRNSIHELAKKNKPWSEDFGQAANQFTIELYLIGKLFKNKDKLIAAIKDKGGPGTLIHPYLGTKTVIISDKARLVESTQEGGWAKFTVTFTEVDETLYSGLSPKADPIGLVDKAAEETTNVSLDDFTANYKMDGSPYWAIKSALDDVNAYVQMSKGQITRVRNTATAAIGSVKNTFNLISSGFMDAFLTPCVIGNTVVDAIDSMLNMANITVGGYAGEILGECSGRVIKRLLSTTGDSVNESTGKSMGQSFIAMAGTSSSTGFGAYVSNSTNLSGAITPINITTPTRARQAANRLAFVNFSKVQNIVGASRCMIRTNYASSTNHDNALNLFLKSVDYTLSKLGDESTSDQFGSYGIYTDNSSLYNSLENLRDVFVSAMKQKNYGLSHVIEYECPPDGITSLQLAYDLYGDITREQEIFDMNKPAIRHPGFFNGTIKVRNV
jgi:prophage DNA circulation protein